MNEQVIRVLVADDHVVVRLGLVTLIDRQKDMRVVAEAANGQQLVELYRTHRPDIVLTDLRMPGLNGVEAITAICREDPQARIIVLTIQKGDESVFRALRAGARGFLNKDVPGQEIVNAVRAVHAGERSIPPDIASRIVERIQHPELSEREVKVLTLIAKGCSNKEMADQLGVSAATIKNHVANLMVKLNAQDRTHAVTVALERNIIDLEDVDVRGPGG